MFRFAESVLFLETLWTLADYLSLRFPYLEYSQPMLFFSRLTCQWKGILKEAEDFKTIVKNVQNDYCPRYSTRINRTIISMKSFLWEQIINILISTNAFSQINKIKTQDFLFMAEGGSLMQMETWGDMFSRGNQKLEAGLKSWKKRETFCTQYFYFF